MRTSASLEKIAGLTDGGGDPSKGKASQLYLEYTVEMDKYYRRAKDLYNNKNTEFFSVVEGTAASFHEDWRKSYGKGEVRPELSRYKKANWHELSDKETLIKKYITNNEDSGSTSEKNKIVLEKVSLPLTDEQKEEIRKMLMSSKDLNKEQDATVDMEIDGDVYAYDGKPIYFNVLVAGHEQPFEIIDINIPWDLLSPSWKAENIDNSMAVGANFIKMGIVDAEGNIVKSKLDELTDTDKKKLANDVHREWLRRPNNAWGLENPFYILSWDVLDKLNTFDPNLLSDTERSILISKGVNMDDPLAVFEALNPEIELFSGLNVPIEKWKNMLKKESAQKAKSTVIDMLLKDESISFTKDQLEKGIMVSIESSGQLKVIIDSEFEELLKEQSLIEKMMAEYVNKFDEGSWKLENLKNAAKEQLEKRAIAVGFTGEWEMSWDLENIKEKEKLGLLVETDMRTVTAATEIAKSVA